MNEINIRELFKIDDSHSKIRGFITLLDENGNVERAAENMIVKSGRELMFNALTGGTAFNLTTSLSAALIKSAEPTTSDMTYDADEIYQEITLELEEDDGSESDQENTLEDDTSSESGSENNGSEEDNGSDDTSSESDQKNKLEVTKSSDLFIKFTLTYEPTESGDFSGIVLYKTDDKKLFSRVIFPKYSHTSSKKYTINYYIYF